MGRNIGRLSRAALIAAALSLSLIAVGARAQNKLVVPIATWGSPTHVAIVNFITPLKQALYRDTLGRISVRHYPGGQLAQDADMPIAIPTGKVKVGWITLAGWSGLIPDVRIADAPTGLTILQTARAIDMRHGLAEVLGKEFAAKGVKLLAFTDLGGPAIVSNKKVLAPSDLKGLRIRVYSEGGEEAMQALGAAPVKMPFADVYEAMQRHTIDAAMIGFQGIASQRMYEVSKYALQPAAFLGSGVTGYAANLQWWNSLSPADRKILAKDVREAELICRYEIIKDREGLAKEYRSKGMDVTILDSKMPQYAEWAKAVAPLWTKAKKQLSPAILKPIEAVQREIRSGR